VVIVNTTPDRSHTHEASLETGLDFINTLEFSRVAPLEHLSSAASAADWLAERGLAHPGEVRTALDDPARLQRLRSVRSAMREITVAAVDQRAADRGAIREVNRALRARSVLELVAAADGITLGHRHVGDGLDDALATLIEPVVREIASGRRDRLRICANETCRWVFFDESRTGKRRWCDMSTCGNRAKAARHRARLRTLGDPGDSGA
jgi:predicted RNA-binding Zn ribbon-like protein